MINPAIRLIALLCFVKKPITPTLHFADIIAKISNGSAIPIPKNKKLNKFVMNAIVEVDIAKRTIKEAGLQGKTIAPKKNPKR